MDKKHFKSIVNAVAAGLLGGSAASALAAAFGVRGPGGWIGAIAAVLLCALSAASSLAAWVLGVCGMVIAAFSNLPGLITLSPLTAGLLGTVLTVMLFLLVRTRAGIPSALIIWLGLTVTSCAAAELPLTMPLPGASAALVLIAINAELQYDKSVWRATAAALILALLALWVTPVGQPTWEPMENAANRVRDVIDNYFHFTAERVPFTITAEGYNHTAYASDGVLVVARLGGSASPDNTPVMWVETDRDLYLRGSIRRDYTGNNWEDNAPKARYLFYDFTRRAARTELFGMGGNDEFAPVTAKVTFLDEGTSALFVPTRLKSLDMPLKDALYYNTIGELFLSRTVESGDSYDLVCYMPEEGEILREAAMTASLRKDSHYNSIVSECTSLPDGIESGVYALTLEITADAQTPYDKAVALAEWLRSSCSYTLHPSMPNDDRDFVSQFVLETREGYCSYYASAMTVMCRIAGIPARYVEGYYVRSNGSGITTVTGEDAHAWTEVYLSGLGWATFDATGGQSGEGEGSDRGDDGETTDESDNAADSSPTEGPDAPGASPSPSPQPSDEPDNGNDAQTPPPELPEDPMSSPTPDPEEDFMNANEPPEDTPDDNGDTEPEPQTEKKRPGPFLWLLLVLLALLTGGIAWFLRKRIMQADPLRIVTKTTPADTAAAVYYRSILELLSVLDIAQLPGETPEQYAKRAAHELEDAPDTLEPFIQVVSTAAYSGAHAGRDALRLGRNAYRKLVTRLTPKQRILWAVRRIREGLGSFEQIP